MELVAQTNTSSLVFLAALMLVIGLLLLRSRRYFARQVRQDADWMPTVPGSPASGQRPGRLPEPPDELARWEVQMHDLARTLSGQLDSKMSALEHLIREADRAAGRLETALAAMQRLNVASPAPGPVASQDTGLSEPRPQAVPPGANQAEAIKTAKSLPPSPRPAGASEPPTADRRYEEIYLLADYGFAPAEIAHRVGMPIGEIQLILSLRSKR